MCDSWGWKAGGGRILTRAEQSALDLHRHKNELSSKQTTPAFENAIKTKKEKQILRFILRCQLIKQDLLLKSPRNCSSNPPRCISLNALARSISILTLLRSDSVPCIVGYRCVGGFHSLCSYSNMVYSTLHF